MHETEEIMRLLDNVNVEDNFETIITQVDRFEQYLIEMGISVEKKQILFHNEDISPQIVFFNN